MNAEYLPIRQLSKEIGLPEAVLRRMHRAGRLAGFYSGRKYFCHVPTLRETLEAAREAGTDVSKGA